jgi:MoaA/NifB/PqqE/SkfB family radical SAM enzyme
MNEYGTIRQSAPTPTGPATDGGPPILEFHPGIGCALNCVFCYRTGNVYERGRTPITAVRVAEVVTEFSAMGGRQLNLSGGLEPFSRPDAACGAVECGYKVGLRVWVYTNGQPAVLKDPSVRDTLLAKAARIRFSVHALSETTFQAVQRPADHATTLQRVNGTVRAFIERRRQPKGTRVGVGFLVVQQNAGELSDAANFWRDAGADFFDVRSDVNGDLSASREVDRAIRRLNGQIRLGRLAPMDVDVSDQGLAGPQFFARYCHTPLQKLAIDPFGGVWFCCLQANPGLRPDWARVGDVTNESLASVVERVKERVPLRHCETCTPWEACYNLRLAATARHRVNAVEKRRCLA